ncbi:ABC transporter substrate-binding protein [Halobacteria archaeon HArc-gm2]|nr:ABC transporter substrate-binding protein [Halobacteria archaeon HArc-gm2]
MSEETRRTRRNVLRTSASLAAVGGLAGCSQDDTGSAATENDVESETATGTPAETASSTESGYSVTMKPVGTVDFEAVPETWATYCQGYADMGIALGQAEGLLSVGYKPRLHTKWYDELDGVSVDKEGLQALYQGGIDKELFYSMDADVHVVDPNWLSNNFKGWEQSDVDDIADEVSPFIGNLIFRQTDEWHDYRYYTMYEAFETVAEVFQEQERYQAFADLHEEYVRGRVADKLPEGDDAVEAAILHAAGEEPEKFAPNRLESSGTALKHVRDLNVQDAFVGTEVQGLSSTNRTKIDFETLLDVDPPVLLVKGHEAKSTQEFQDTVVAHFENHDVGASLTAVQEGRIFRGGPVYQGPIHNLFLVERLAKNLYPDTFSGELFDRQRVADIVTGEF